MQIASPLFLAAHFASSDFLQAMLSTLTTQDIDSLRGDRDLLERLLTDTIQQTYTNVFVWLVDTLRIDLNICVVCTIVRI